MSSLRAVNILSGMNIDLTVHLSLEKKKPMAVLLTCVNVLKILKDNYYTNMKCQHCA